MSLPSMEPSSEIVAAWLRALCDVPAITFALPLAAPLLVLLRARRPGGLKPWLGRVLLAAVIAAGMLWAWQLKWVGDDAFISFRYARNLIEGHGLVFNPGERVEGYTNFLWTLLVAGSLALGSHPAQFSVVLGFLCFAGTLLALQRLTERIGTRGDSQRPTALPSLAVVLAASGYLLASYASSGLETMFAAMLVLLSLEQAERRRPLAAGLLGVGATLAHPDQGIFYAALGGALLLQRERVSPLARYALPFFLLFVPYFLWRWHYYGDLYPNTFYAKSGDRAYYRQGGVYLLASALAMGLPWMLPLALIGARCRARTRVVKTCLLAIPAFILYAARIGGDFMLGRLLVTPALLLCLLAGLGFEELLSKRAWRRAVLLGTVAALSMLPIRLIKPQAKTWYIADEGSFYRLASFWPPYVRSLYTLESEALQQNLLARGLRPKLATDCVGIVGYETGLELFDLLGLTSRAVAHTPIERRRRPGHEKVGSPGQILESGSQLSKLPVYPPPYAALTAVTLDDFHYFLSGWYPELGPALARRSQARDAGSELRRMANALSERSEAGRACDLWFARDYYFRHNADPELQDRWLAKLESSLPKEEARALLLAAATPDSLGYARVLSMDFDGKLDGWTREGDAFSNTPARSAAVGQDEVLNASRGFANSFAPEVGDAATGRLVSPPFLLDGDLVTLMVGGGARGVTVALLVDGHRVRTASGCGSEILRREVWDVRELRGRTASLELVDETREAGGHLLVDDVTVWARGVMRLGANSLGCGLPFPASNTKCRADSIAGP